MKPDVMQQNKDGSWFPAKEVPYYPSLWEKFLCFIGKHHKPTIEIIKPEQYEVCCRCK